MTAISLILLFLGLYLIWRTLRPMKRTELRIGDEVIDEDGNIGIVGIKYNDGDFVFWPGGNDAAHPNPKKIEKKPNVTRNMS